MKRCVSVLGGDPRQLYLAELFREEGHTVHTWGLAPPERERPRAPEQRPRPELRAREQPAARRRERVPPEREPEQGLPREWEPLRAFPQASVPLPEQALPPAVPR